MVKPFQFKQFTVQQDRCAMKIGTDGVLLGAWTSIKNNPNTILDIGAGTGVIALQLAQRCDANVIDALEIDGNAYEQCVENFENSPWSDRLFCFHADLEEFTQEIDDTYDLIISNPPFHSENYKTNNKERDIARFAESLPFDHLIDCVSILLSEKGTFSVIIPRKVESHFVLLASKSNLFPTRICHVHGVPGVDAKRSMIAFSFQKTTPEITSLIIETERNNYTEDYKNLVRDFYLKM